MPASINLEEDVKGVVTEAICGLLEYLLDCSGGGYCFGAAIGCKASTVQIGQRVTRLVHLVSTRTIKMVCIISLDIVYG